MSNNIIEHDDIDYGFEISKNEIEKNYEEKSELFNEWNEQFLTFVEDFENFQQKHNIDDLNITTKHVRSFFKQKMNNLTKSKDEQIKKLEDKMRRIKEDEEENDDESFIGYDESFAYQYFPDVPEIKKSLPKVQTQEYSYADIFVAGSLALYGIAMVSYFISIIPNILL